MCFFLLCSQEIDSKIFYATGILQIIQTIHGDRLHKIRPIIDYFNNSMDNLYYPNKELCIDESMMLWRGRLLFRQYIKNKRHKFGIKFFELCESRGTILRIRIYEGKSFADEFGLGQSAAVVLELMEGYLNKGHMLFTDNYYNSVSLTKILSARSTYLCGTLRSNHRENPKHVITKKLKRGEVEWSRSDSVVVLKWKDKRDVYAITNMHKVEMVDVTSRSGRTAQKPNAIMDYNNGMSGIDR